MLKSFLSHLYYERKWKHPINQFLIYVRGAFKSYDEPRDKLIVFAQGRTGSTVLVDLINQLEDVHCDGEIYGAGMPRKIWFPKAYLRSLIKTRTAPIYGFRLKVYDMTLEHGFSREENRAFIKKFFDEGWKVIYLKRDRKLRQALSSLLAEARDQFHAEETGAVQGAVKIDAQSIPYRLNLLDSFCEEEEKCLEGIEHLKVSYEDDLLDQSGHQPLLDRIADYLNVNTAVAKSKYKRTVKDNLEDQVTNLDEVRSILTTNNLDAYLKEL